MKTILKLFYLLCLATVLFLSFHLIQLYKTNAPPLPMKRSIDNFALLDHEGKFQELYYYSDKKECDFVIKEGSKITQVIQCCYELTRDNKEREIAGLTEAMDKFKLKEGLILTYDQNEEISLKGNKMLVKSVWKWLLQ